MAAPAPTTTDASAPPRWGLGDALGGWILAYAAAIVAGSVLLSALGYGDTDPDDLPLSVVALGYPPLWLGFVGVPVYVAATKGRGVVRDFRARVAAIDVPVGLVSGLAAQLVLVPVISAPWIWILGKNLDDLEGPARDLADKANGAPGVLLFFLIVGIGAPIAEELFFRGLVLRAFEKRFGTTWAVVGSSVAFGATHFQLLQFPALTAAGLVFALLAVRYDRLGPAILAHVAFNTTTVVLLVAR